MKDFTSFQYYHNSKSDTLDVILHGGSPEGMEMSLIRKAYKLSVGQSHSAITFNFPFAERGQDQSSGPELEEELVSLQKFLDYCDYKSFKRVRLIGKSLGAIVASFYLDKLPEDEQNRFSVVVLGYVTGSLKLKSFKGPITVIQGEKDKFGDIETVKKDLRGARSKQIRYYEIKNADHSFRDPETKEPLYENNAMRILSSSK
jgi:predicted alpha/beta-hydrolase family hydrolase